MKLFLSPNYPIELPLTVNNNWRKERSNEIEVEFNT